MGRVEAAIDDDTWLLALPLDARTRSLVRVNRGHAHLVLGRSDRTTEDFTAVIDDPDAPDDQRFMARSNPDELRARLADLRDPTTDQG